MRDIVERVINKREVYSGNDNFNESSLISLVVSCVMIWLMVPGLGFLYSGLARRKSALSMIWIVMLSSFIGIFQWYFWGFSLAFSSTSTNSFIGNLHHFGFQHVLGEVSEGTDYPQISWAIFQMQFLLVTLAILAGGCIAERGRFLPAMVFFFCWSTIVYCPLVWWIWGDGWASSWRGGALDYAGGGPVEIASGISAFVYSAFLGRRNETLMINYRPHNISTVCLGTVMLYFGWLFFNGFSAAGANLKVPYSMFNTHLCAAFAAVSWCLLDFRLEKKWSMVAVCSGCISGLVAATPSSGMIPLWASVILGVVSGVVCNFSTQIKYLCRVDDSLDVLAEHGIAGIIGLIFNALFGSSDVIGYDGSTVHAGGWLNHNYKQLYIQIVYILATFSYAGGVTAVLCLIINYIPGLRLRLDYNAEEIGVDEAEIGEFAYDYVEVRRHFLDWNEPHIDNVLHGTRANIEGIAGDEQEPKVESSNGSTNVMEEQEKNSQRGEAGNHLEDTHEINKKEGDSNT